MIIRKWVITAVFFLFPVFITQVVEANEIGDFNGQFWNATVCNTCSTEQDFKYAASFYNLGKVTVFNLDSRQVRTYSAEMGTTFGDVTHVRVATPTEAYEALDEYDQLKSDLAQMAPQAMSSDDPQGYTANSIPLIPGPVFGTICGAEGSITSRYIPDGIFAAACSAHDQCYASGNYSKMFCDDLFLEALRTSSLDATKDLNVFLKSLLREALLAASDLYYSAVVNLESAFNAYCAVDTNSSTGFCLAGHDANQLKLDGSGGVVGGSYTGGVSFTYGGVTINYDYRCIPTRVGATDNFGEDSWVNQYCEFVIASVSD